MRNSDPDAALYWLARMLESGEDPLYLARRMVRMASEDIGLAEPGALAVTLAAKEAFDFIGPPEGNLALAQAAVYLSLAPKSNALYTAYGEVMEDVHKTEADPVPLHLRNAVTGLMKNVGYGQGYKYAHNFDEKVTDMWCLPDNLAGRAYYHPTDQGFEHRIRQRLEDIRKIKSRPSRNLRCSMRFVAFCHACVALDRCVARQRRCCAGAAGDHRDCAGALSRHGHGRFARLLRENAWFAASIAGLFQPAKAATCFIVNSLQQLELVPSDPADTNNGGSGWLSRARRQRHARVLPCARRQVQRGKARRFRRQIYRSARSGRPPRSVSFPGTGTMSSVAISPLSNQIIHAGFVVRDRAAEDAFYKEILGFRLYWHGGMKDDETSWVAMEVPNGTTWLEYMLNISPTADHHTLWRDESYFPGRHDIKKPTHS